MLSYKLLNSFLIGCGVFLLTSAQNVTAQNGNELFTLNKSSFKENVLQYSPTFINGKWMYTQIENEAVLLKTLGSDESTPIAGFNLRNSVVTGFGIAGQNGLIAISIGEKSTSIPAKLKNNKIWFAHQDGKGFAAKYFEFQLNNQGYSVTTPFISPDGTKMYFASDMPGGYGGFDLYVCDYRGKEWSKPRNLGSRINTEGDEIYPNMVDNVLFFSSNSHGGQRFDIFIADMGQDRGRLVLNPGNPINSAAHDYAMTFDNKTGRGFFLSDRDGVNGKVFEVSNVQKLLLLNIRSNNDRSPLGGAKLDLSRCRKNAMYANSEGSVIMPVSPGEDCFINIEKIGYNSTVIKLEYKAIVGLKKSIDIYLSEEGVFYNGYVKNEKGEPAPGVELTIIDQATGDQQMCFTDNNGKYKAALEPLSFYMIRTKSPYYEASANRISTLASVPQSVLGTITIKSNGIMPPAIKTSSIMQTEEITTEEKQEHSTPIQYENTTKPPVKDNQSSDKDQSSIQVKEEPVLIASSETKTIATPPTTPIHQPVIVDMPKEPVAMNKSKYSIQLAAVSPDVTDVSSYAKKVNNLGTVYYVREGNYNKIRLGFFDTQEDAKAARERLPQDLKGGFIVEEKNTPVVANKTPTPAPAPAATTALNHDQVNMEHEEHRGKLDKKEYKIRLSTLKDPKLFNGNKVKQFGLVEEVKTGDLIVFYLTGFESLEETKEVINKVKEAGFPTAHIVSYSNGEYSKVD